MRSVKVALAGGLALLALAICLTLLGSPTSVARTNTRGNGAGIWETHNGAKYCQAHETLPASTSAIRIWLDAAAGPRVSVLVTSSDGRVLTGGSRPSIWVGGSVTIPVKPLPHTASDVTVCASFRLLDETVIVQGSLTSARAATHEGSVALFGRMGIEYLHRAGRTWASQAPEVARRMGLGRAAPGSWIALLALALLGSIVLLASRLVLRELA